MGGRGGGGWGSTTAVLLQQHLLLLSTSLLLVGFVVVVVAPSPAALQERCSGYMGKLSDCLVYSTAMSDTPSEGCCKSVSEIRRDAPVCLCYVIQQTNNASFHIIYNLGLQIGRLVELPRACNIGNTNVSLCPVLLGISPRSPDYFIFNSTAADKTASAGGRSPGRGHRVRRYSWNAAVVASAVLFSSLISVVG